MADERRVAAGGWRRGVVGTLVGSVLGLVISRLVPRDDPNGGNRAAAGTATTPGPDAP